jgi:hypothetical protein
VVFRLKSSTRPGTQVSPICNGSPPPCVLRHWYRFTPLSRNSSPSCSRTSSSAKMENGGRFEWKISRRARRAALGGLMTCSSLIDLTDGAILEVVGSLPDDIQAAIIFRSKRATDRNPGYGRPSRDRRSSPSWRASDHRAISAGDRRALGGSSGRTTSACQFRCNCRRFDECRDER